MAENSSNKKVANSLVAVSCAAVLAVYSAGYLRTRSAADRFEVQAAERRTAIPAPSEPTAVPVSEPAARLAPAAVSPTEVTDVRSSEPVEKPIVIASAETMPEPSSVSPVAVVEAPVPAPAPELTVKIAELAPPLPEHKIEIAAPALPPAPKWKDGTYLGWGTSRHGDIQAAVVIENGRIASATIAQCRTRYSCDVIDKLPPQVAQRQSPDVDYVSRATQSADAFYYAVVEALGKAKN